MLALTASLMSSLPMLSMVTLATTKRAPSVPSGFATFLVVEWTEEVLSFT